jgi:hypothetical protein
MKKTALVGAVAGLVLAGGAGSLALAAPHVASIDSTLHVTVSPRTPAQGETVTAKMTGGKKKVGYVCILTTYKQGVKLTADDSNVNSAVLNIHPNKNDVAKCQQVFLKFTSPHGHSCPPTHKDKKHGWKCGVAFADPNHRSHWNVGLFKF